jgi:hypothetical protein
VDVLFTDVTPLSKACYREDFASDEEYGAADCHAEGGRTLGVAWDLRTHDGVWGTFGQLAGSQVNGFSRRRLLRDGTDIGPGDYGWGTYARAGKLDGEPFRIFLQYEHSSPRFEVNQAGFLQSQNMQTLWGDARLVRSAPLGPIRDLYIGVYAGADWTTDGRMLNRFNIVGMFSEAVIPGLDYTGLGANCEYVDGAYDIREIPSANIPYRKAPSILCAVALWTNESRPVALRFKTYRYQNLPQGVLVGRAGYGGEAVLTVRPTPALETQITAYLERPALTARFLDYTDEDSLRFAGLVATQASLQLRQQMVITPELTLQGYAQLFTAHGHHGPFYEADYVGRPMEMTDLRRAEDYAADYDFRGSALAINVVARWEYRLGSILYAVYSRSQQSLPLSGLATPGLPGLTLAGLRGGRATDTFLVKWSWYWDAAL